MSSNKQALSILETVFLVMVVTNAVLPHAHAVDPARAHAAALFRLAMIGIGLSGSIIVFILKRRLPPDRQFVTPPVASVFPGTGVVSHDGILSVTYNSARADQWRCHCYVLAHRWQGTALLYLFPFVFCLFHWPRWMAHGAFSLLGGTVITLAAWTAILGLIFWVQIVQRLPNRDSLRLCTTALTPLGLQDAVPEKTMTYEWRSIATIRENDGDIYFWVGMTNGNFIPRTAFRDRSEAQEFYHAAQAFWKGQGFAWTRSPAPDHATWPPPPQMW